MQFIDDAEFQINIDLDQGARISSLIWRDMQFAVPFRGSPMTYGWYAMAPWAGRVRDGIIKSPSGEEFQLPTNAYPPHAIHGFGYESSWQEIGPGRSMLHLPKPYGGGTFEQSIEVLDDAKMGEMAALSIYFDEPEVKNTVFTKIQAKNRRAL